MSFLGTSARPYDPLSQSELSHLQRPPVHTLDSFDHLSQPPMQPLVHQPATHPHSHQSHLPDRPQISLPKVGQTRCYWALLSTSLRFLYCDPVLAYHLHEQADVLIGKSLLDFVHPDEQASAEVDLGGVLDSRTLHGSVTRVRFSRLSRVRRELGHRGTTPPWADAEKISVDDNYMAVDLVINYAADGVVLCFIHAVVDLTPHDNDEYHKTGWTNWCGTPYMSQEEVNLLFQRLYHTIPPSTSTERVFQILLNQPDRPLWCSWPPDRQQVQGGPVAKDFAKLAADVNIGNSPNSSSDAKTSCTRRYKAQQTMSYGVDGYSDVESIFIPYGSIIFACHKLDSPDSHKPGNAYLLNPSPQYYDTPAYNLPPLNVPSDSYPGAYPPHSANPQYSQGWSASSDSAQSAYNQWTPQHAAVSSSPSVSSIRSSSYASQAPPPPPQQQQTSQQQHQWSSQPPASAYMEPEGAPGYYPGNVQQYDSTPASSTPAADNSPPPPDDVVPAARSGSRRAANKEQYAGNRSTGQPPAGVMKCSSCKATHSPEWRKGPSGKKDLCNACGLRYARSRAKKEGGPVRRRKDKVLAAMSNKSEHSPSTSPVNVPYNDTRRGSVFDENAQRSAGSIGNEAYPPNPQHAPPHHLSGTNGMTPSPSPPSGSGSFAYPSHHSSSQHEHHPHAQSGDQRGHYSQPSFYSMPSVSGPGSSHSLPPISGMPYSNHRISPPSQSPPSPLPGTHFSLPSFERDRHRDRERERISLTPVSSDLRADTGKY